MYTYINLLFILNIILATYIELVIIPNMYSLDYSKHV